MKGIYILGIVIIFIVLIGILFYYEDNNFKITINPYSITYINQQNGGFILKLNVSAINSGFLPMSSSLSITLYANLFSQSSKFGINKEFTNSTTISVGPFSKKSVIVTYYFPSTLSYISEIIINGNGYYNYKINYYITNNIIMEINNMKDNISGYYQPSITIHYDNIPLKTTGSLFQIFSIINTLYHNGTTSRSLYLFLYPNLLAVKNGSYNLKIISNSHIVYNNIISIPFPGSYVYAHLITTSPIASEYSFNVSIIIENNMHKYIFNFTVTT